MKAHSVRWLSQLVQLVKHKSLCLVLSVVERTALLCSAVYFLVDQRFCEVRSSAMNVHCKVFSLTDALEQFDSAAQRLCLICSCVHDNDLSEHVLFAACTPVLSHPLRSAKRALRHVDKNSVLPFLLRMSVCQCSPVFLGSSLFAGVHIQASALMW